MKNKTIMMLIVLVVLSGIVYGVGTGWSITKKEQCVEKTVQYQEEIPIYGNVTKYRTKWKIVEKYESSNDTYYNVRVEDGTEAYQEEKLLDTRVVAKQKVVCVKDTSYLEIKQDAKTLVLDYLSKDFECRQDGDSIECDSKLDGNGDGVCKSGESCYYIEEVDGCLEVSQINSLDRGASVRELTVNGVCVRVISDDSFKPEWDLVGGELI